LSFNAFLFVSLDRTILKKSRRYQYDWVRARDVEAEAGSGPFSVEAEARKSYRSRFHIGYLTWRVTWRKSFVHFPMWI